jgi:diguanylate cyclase (GGDEF)-like protein
MSALSLFLPTWRGRTTGLRLPWLSWTIAFGAALSAALVGVEVWQMSHVRVATLRNATAVTASLAQSLALQIDNAFKTADTVVASIGERVEAEGTGASAQERLYGLMTSLARALPAIHEMGIINRDGNAVLKASIRSPVGLNYRDRDYFRHLAAHPGHDLFIGQPVRSKVEGSLNLTLSRRIEGPDGRFDGIVVASVSMDFFRRMFESVDPTSLIALVGPDGHVLVRSRAGFGDRERAAIAVADGGLQYIGADGTPRVGSVRSLAQYPLTVIVAQNTSDILADWRTQVRNHAAVVFAVLLALGFLGWRLEIATRSTRIQALHDTLTGLANRRSLNDAIDSEFRRAARKGESLSFVMADIDLFKKFNDTYGHQAGDDCLKAVASAVEGVLGRAGDMAARYGGEEIAILIPDTDTAGATRIAERMQSAVNALAIPHESSPYGIVTISAGVATCVPNPVSSWKPLVRAADEALYAAKAAGRNTFRISKS